MKQNKNTLKKEKPSPPPTTKKERVKVGDTRHKPAELRGPAELSEIHPRGDTATAPAAEELTPHWSALQPPLTLPPPVHPAELASVPLTWGSCPRSP